MRTQSTEKSPVTAMEIRESFFVFCLFHFPYLFIFILCVVRCALWVSDWEKKDEKLIFNHRQDICLPRFGFCHIFLSILEKEKQIHSVVFNMPNWKSEKKMREKEDKEGKGERKLGKISMFLHLLFVSSKFWYLLYWPLFYGRDCTEANGIKIKRRKKTTTVQMKIIVILRCFLCDRATFELPFIFMRLVIFGHTKSSYDHE